MNIYGFGQGERVEGTILHGSFSGTVVPWGVFHQQIGMPGLEHNDFDVHTTRCRYCGRRVDYRHFECQGCGAPV